LIPAVFGDKKISSDCLRDVEVGNKNLITLKALNIEVQRAIKKLKPKTVNTLR
jgi:hypothetical protein